MEFKSFARAGHCATLLKTLDVCPDPFEIYKNLRRGDPAGRPYSVLLDSARVSPKTGRYSIIASNPFLILSAKNGETTLGTKKICGDPFEILRGLLRQFAHERFPGYPSFTGGAIGYLGYEAKHFIEPKLSGHGKKDDLGLPDLYFMFFDEGVVTDHKLKKTYFFANVRVGRDARRSYDLALKKLFHLENKLKKRALRVISDPVPRGHVSRRSIKFQRYLTCPLGTGSGERQGFIDRVQKIKRYIRQGEIFQANLSQRFSFEIDKSPLEIYQNLRRINPSSFFGFLQGPDFELLSGSPERLAKLENGLLETRPIAGTRSRGKTAAQDEALSMELILDEKERAEHIMLVDLERNDLGRVAEYGSVCVDELMALENYSHVKHIVSNVRGILKKNLDAVDVLKSFFPGGTITGAPKVRCMEILEELEPVARGPYTGSLGYLSSSGNMDFNILIRSLVVKGGTAHLHVGAGIVADSAPEKEYEETLYKAKAVFEAVFGERLAAPACPCLPAGRRHGRRCAATRVSG